MSRLPSGSNEKALSEFRDLILDLRADLLAFYKVAILEVRRADNPEDVAKYGKRCFPFEAQSDGPIACPQAKMARAPAKVIAAAMISFAIKPSNIITPHRREPQN